VTTIAICQFLGQWFDAGSGPIYAAFSFISTIIMVKMAIIIINNNNTLQEKKGLITGT
jgi:hypothetical protein